MKTEKQFWEKNWSAISLFHYPVKSYGRVNSIGIIENLGIIEYRYYSDGITENSENRKQDKIHKWEYC